MRQKKIKRRAAAIAIPVAAAVCLTGCSGRAPDGNATLITSDSGQTVSYGAAAVCLRYNQALLYDYYQGIYSAYGLTTGPLWGRKSGGETMGARLKKSVADELSAALACREKAPEYGVNISDSDKKTILDAAGDFTLKTDKDTLRENGISLSSASEFLELMTYEYKVREKVEEKASVSVSDREAVQASVSYYAVKPKDELPLEKIQENLKEDGEKYYEALKKERGADESKRTVTYSRPETDVLPEEAAAAVSKMENGEYAAVKANGQIYVLHMNSTNDKKATEKQRKALESEQKYEAFKETAEGWEKEMGIKVNNRLYRSLKITDKAAYTMQGESTEPLTENINTRTGTETEAEK